MTRLQLSLSLVSLASALALGGAARAGSSTPDQPPARDRAGRATQGAKASAEPLSPEDAALVRELALLERVELLRNLELFEPSKQPRQTGKKGEP